MLLSSRVGCALLAVFFACQTGCVQRRMIVQSNPPGALVYVDDQEKPIGVTPCAHDFTYYGTRKFRLVKEGYETVTEMRDIPAPWYEYPVCDFVSENLVPGQIRDQRTLDFKLTPQLVVSSDQVLARGEELRRGIHSATNTTSQLAPGRRPNVNRPTAVQPATVQPALQQPVMNPPPTWQPAGGGVMPSAAPATPPAVPPYATPAAGPGTTTPPTAPTENIGGQPTYPLP